jgi:hypothetical protein
MLRSGWVTPKPNPVHNGHELGPPMSVPVSGAISAIPSQSPLTGAPPSSVDLSITTLSAPPGCSPNQYSPGRPERRTVTAKASRRSPGSTADLRGENRIPAEAIRIAMGDLRRRIDRFEQEKAAELETLKLALEAGRALLSECRRPTDGGTPG